eukprot:gene10153-21168_t
MVSSSSIETAGILIDFPGNTQRLIQYIVFRNLSILNSSNGDLQDASRDLCIQNNIHDDTCPQQVFESIRAHPMTKHSHTPSGAIDSMFRDSQYTIRSYNNSKMTVPVGRGTLGQPQIYWLFTDYSTVHTGLTFGRYCVLNENVIVWLGGNHCYKRISTYPWHQRSHAIHTTANYSLREFHPRNDDCPEAAARPMVIGNDVYIGANVAFVRGVTVGDGAVIRAFSVVRKDVEPYSIVEGNPARLVGYRFEKDVVDALLEIRWWDWTDEELDDRAELFRLMEDRAELIVDTVKRNDW